MHPQYLMPALRFNLFRTLVIIIVMETLSRAPQAWLSSLLITGNEAFVEARIALFGQTIQRTCMHAWVQARRPAPLTTVANCKQKTIKVSTTRAVAPRCGHLSGAPTCHRTCVCLDTSADGTPARTLLAWKWLFAVCGLATKGAMYVDVMH
jgi:hypothetical protein